MHWRDRFDCRPLPSVSLPSPSPTPTPPFFPPSVPPSEHTLSSTLTRHTHMIYKCFGNAIGWQVHDRIVHDRIVREGISVSAHHNVPTSGGGKQWFALRGRFSKVCVSLQLCICGFRCAVGCPPQPIFQRVCAHTRVCRGLKGGGW